VSQFLFFGAIRNLHVNNTGARGVVFRYTRRLWCWRNKMRND